MSSTSVYDAFKARLVDQLGSTYAIRDFEEIETELQHGVDPWIALEDSGAEPELQSIGTPSENWTQDTGFFDVHCFVPSTGGLGPARDLGQLVRDAFQYYRPTVPAGETLRVTTVSAPEPGFVGNGLWHTVIVSISYTHQFAVATAAA